MDHQPKIAFGAPLEPAADKLVMQSPVLTASGELVGELNGASAATSKARSLSASARVQRVCFGSRCNRFQVQGEANWGEITFTLDGKDYTLVAAAPVTGGEQPRAVWVRRDGQLRWGAGCRQGCLGAGPTPR